MSDLTRMRRLLLAAAVVAVRSAPPSTSTRRGRPGTSGFAIRCTTPSSSASMRRRTRPRSGSASPRSSTRSRSPDTGARPPSGAIGLMQRRRHRPGDRDPHRRLAFRTADLYDPEINIRYGAWYLENLFRKYGREARAGRLQRRPGQRRPLAREPRADPVRRDARVRQRVEHLKTHLPPRLGKQLGY